ncbi:FecR family protein [Dyadobacter diqingensis]|uniref:FecR family protein n=1 Tax=Dyadobacter diqingensis TaxID=2938121 RepID=UPI0020C235EC|nr:FecR family protein [Dyadobacter diqingensis]
MTQQEFNKLSRRYLEGQTTQEEETYLMEWFGAQPPLVQADLTGSQKNALQKQIWKKIHTRIRPRWRVLSNQTAWICGLAACMVAGLFWFTDLRLFAVRQLVSFIEPTMQEGIEVTNTTQSDQQVKLEDGTVVLLRQNSSLVYDKSFNVSKRVVYLKGEAFFKVKRDVTKPFVVHTGDLVTEVLGTSFRIRPNPKTNQIEVSVATGRVSVYTEKDDRPAERNGHILTPNQRVIFDVASKNITPGIVEAPVPITSGAAPAQILLFNNVSLDAVMTALSQRYGIEFVIANPKSRDCRITADLNGLSMYTQLDLICKSIDATYQKRGTVIFIDGDGC